mgnify:FL=1
MGIFIKGLDADPEYAIVRTIKSVDYECFEAVCYEVCLIVVPVHTVKERVDEWFKKDDILLVDEEPKPAIDDTEYVSKMVKRVLEELKKAPLFRPIY